MFYSIRGRDVRELVCGPRLVRWTGTNSDNGVHAICLTFPLPELPPLPCCCEYNKVTIPSLPQSKDNSVHWLNCRPCLNIWSVEIGNGLLYLYSEPGPVRWSIHPPRNIGHHLISIRWPHYLLSSDSRASYVWRRSAWPGESCFHWSTEEAGGLTMWSENDSSRGDISRVAGIQRQMGLRQPS